jgi:putative two-component system response regulator
MRASPEFIDARILVVDDEKANLLLIERILERAGYHDVRSTSDPEAVLGLIEEFRPDLLLLDLKMPRLDGLQILERVRAVDQVSPSPSLPVLVLTADATREGKQRALESGARDFLTKPIDVEEVLLRVASMLEIRFRTRAVHTGENPN